MNAVDAPVLSPFAIPLVAVESMNETHRQEVDLINRLGALLRRKANDAERNDSITQVLLEWVEHTRQHFDGENQLMLKHGFPAYSMHSAEHARVLTQIEYLQNSWRTDQSIAPLADFIFTTWPQWFDTHVNSMDRVTAQFVSLQTA